MPQKSRQFGNYFYCPKNPRNKKIFFSQKIRAVILFNYLISYLFCDHINKNRSKTLCWSMTGPTRPKQQPRPTILCWFCVDPATIFSSSECETIFIAFHCGALSTTKGLCPCTIQHNDLKFSILHAYYLFYPPNIFQIGRPHVLVTTARATRLQKRGGNTAVTSRQIALAPRTLIWLRYAYIDMYPFVSIEGGTCSRNYVYSVIVSSLVCYLCWWWTWRLFQNPTDKWSYEGVSWWSWVTRHRP